MPGGSCLLSTWAWVVCTEAAGAGSSLHIPAFSRQELGSSALPGVRQQKELQAGLRPRQAPVAKHRHSAASTASASGWAAKEQNRDNGMGGGRNVLHSS